MHTCEFDFLEVFWRRVKLGWDIANSGLLRSVAGLLGFRAHPFTFLANPLLNRRTAALNRFQLFGRKTDGKTVKNAGGLGRVKGFWKIAFLLRIDFILFLAWLFILFRCCLFCTMFDSKLHFLCLVGLDDNYLVKMRTDKNKFWVLIASLGIIIYQTVLGL